LISCSGLNEVENVIPEFKPDILTSHFGADEE
jgi:hypothetical protein